MAGASTGWARQGPMSHKSETQQTWLGEHGPSLAHGGEEGVWDATCPTCPTFPACSHSPHLQDAGGGDGGEDLVVNFACLRQSPPDQLAFAALLDISLHNLRCGVEAFSFVELLGGRGLGKSEPVLCW